MELSTEAIWRAADARGIVPAVDMPAAFDVALRRWNDAGPKACGHASPVYVAELSENSVLCIACAVMHAAEVVPRCAGCLATGVELVPGAVSGFWHEVDVLLSFQICTACMATHEGENDDEHND